LLPVTALYSKAVRADLSESALVPATLSMLHNWDSRDERLKVIRQLVAPDVNERRNTTVAVVRLLYPLVAYYGCIFSGAVERVR